MHINPESGGETGPGAGLGEILIVTGEALIGYRSEGWRAAELR